MATNEGLSLRIGATVDALKRGFAEAKAIITGTTKEIESESKAIEGANRSWNQMGKFIFQQTYERKRLLQQIQQGIGGWKLEAKAIDEVANGAIPALQRNTKGASSTLIGFGRIIQDAPYGIIGIGNNITQFAEQFQYLRAQTGSTGSALKSLGSSLLGAGGLTVGISLLVTGITTLTQKYGSLGAAIDAFIKPLSEHQKLQKELTNTISEGQKSAQSELIHLESLYDATQNINIPLKERSRLVDELQRQYPSYFGNLTNEEILAGNAADAYNRLKDSIIAVATSRALEKKIEEGAAKRIDLVVEENDLREKRLAAVEDQIKAEERLDKLLNQGVRSKGAVEVQDQLTQKVVTTSKAVENYTSELDKNKAKQDEVTSSINKFKQLADQIKIQFGAAAFEIKETTKAIKKQREEVSKIELNKVSGRQDIFQRPEPISFAQPIDIQLDQANIQAQQDKFKAAYKKIINDPLEGARIDMQAGLVRLNESINEGLQGLAASGIAAVGDIIGSSIVGSTGGIKDAIRSFVNVLGGYMQEVGKKMIIFSGVLDGLQIAISNLNPAAAAIAGAAAIVAGGALKAYASKVPSFATGGGVFQPTMAMIGDNPGREEYVIPSEVLDKLGGGTGGYPREITLRAYGPDLVGVLRLGQMQNGRING